MTTGEKKIWQEQVDSILVSPIGASVVEMLGDFTLNVNENTDTASIQKIGTLLGKDVYLDTYYMEDKIVIILKRHLLEKIKD